ncbi:MAG: 2'-5' RNA ligase family protein [Methanoregula sp.]|nr:2'-5' RNA ligase family protein [Methanoregula sp.]
MTQYQIEFRFQDDVLSKVKQMIYHLEAKFHLDFFKTTRPFPPVTLAGPLTTADEKRLVTDFITLCAKTPFCAFGINTYAAFDAARAVCIRLDPEEKLVAFRQNLAQQCAPYCQLAVRDTKDPFVFHATIAKDINPQKYALIKKFIEQVKPQQFRYHVIRATIIREKEFLCEYDFLTHSVLTRKEALDKKQEFTDRSLYVQFINKRFDPDVRLEDIPHIPDEIFAHPVWAKITDSIKKI